MAFTNVNAGDSLHSFSFRHVFFLIFSIVLVNLGLLSEISIAPFRSPQSAYSLIGERLN